MIIMTVFLYDVALKEDANTIRIRMQKPGALVAENCGEISKRFASCVVVLHTHTHTTTQDGR